MAGNSDNREHRKSQVANRNSRSHIAHRRSQLQRPSDLRPSDLQTSDPRPSDLRPSDLQTSDLQTFRPQTFRPSDLRPSDLQTSDLQTSDLQTSDLQTSDKNIIFGYPTNSYHEKIIHIQKKLSWHGCSRGGGRHRCAGIHHIMFNRKTRKSRAANNA